MASLRAHLINSAIRWYIKRRMKGAADVYKARAAFKSVLAMPTPRSLVVEPATIGGVRGERVEPRHPAPRTLLYLHGGGYFGCSPQTHRPITTAFARHGFKVFAPDYRLAPEHPFPAAVEDAVAVAKALLASGVPPRMLVIAGDSAGGGLTLATLIALRDAGSPLPAAAALFSPWTDLAATGDSLRTNCERDAMFDGAGIGAYAKFYLGSADPRSPLASPLYADLAGLPPLLIHVGEREVLLDDSTRLAERAHTAGVTVELTVWPVVPHAFPIFRQLLPEGRQSLALAAEFLSRHCGQE